MSALRGLKVLDCTNALAGPWCSMLLADLGADVTRIEGPKGDITRIRHGAYAMHNDINRNKRSLCVDLSTEEGRGVVRRLAETADVFVENWRPGVLERMGLGYQDLAAINPALIYCSISGFGHDGPYRQRGAYDLVTQGMSGLMSFNGTAEGGPVPLAIPISDLNAGTFGAMAVLAALNNRNATGEGQHVEATLLETALAYSIMQVGLYLANGEIPVPLGTRHRLSTPFGAFATQDGDIVIAAGTGGLFERMCDVLEVPELAQDPAFAEPRARMANQDAFAQRLEEVLAKDTTANWVLKLAEAGIPAGPLNNIAEALEDPQVKARGLLVEVDGLSSIRTPVTLHGSPVEITRGPAALGAHSREVLLQFGFSQDEIAELVKGGAVLMEAEQGS